MKDLSINHRRDGSVFAGLQHTGAARRDHRQHLEYHLIDRPVPRRNQSTNPYGLPQQHFTIVEGFSFFKLLECRHKAIQVPYRRVGLRFTRHGNRRAHFHSHGLCQLFKSLLANVSYTL